MMKNIALFLILILFSCLTKAQKGDRITIIEQPSDATILDIVPKENVVSSYKVSNVRRMYNKDSIQNEVKFEFLLKEKVISKNETSSIVEWQLNQEVFKYQIFTLPTFNALEKEHHPFKIRFEIGHRGELLNIVNCEEVRNYIVQMYNLNDAIADTIEGFVFTYGYHYKQPYKEDNTCLNTKKLFKMILFDVFYGLHGMPLAKDTSSYVQVADTTSMTNHYWRINGYQHIKTSQITKNQYRIEDLYYDKSPKAIEKYISERSPKNKENDSFSKEMAAFLTALMTDLKNKAKEEGYSDKQIDSIISEIENEPITPFTKKKFEFYKPFIPKERYVIYNSKKERVEKIYVEINSDFSNDELSYVRLQHRMMCIERVDTP
ncbi:hypothetical protein GCM10009430_05730 [Aquimarina litoralis]|uniref:Uncharacterized protein n=1 Tax=Aquimarina litoralis TaxID=584605 RepID=A0ABP3TNG8_9FLAO